MIKKIIIGLIIAVLALGLLPNLGVPLPVLADDSTTGFEVKKVALEKQPKDPLVLRTLLARGIDKQYVELKMDYGIRSQGKNPYSQIWSDRKSNIHVMVVSILPRVTADGQPIESGWELVGDKYVAKPNLFSAVVEDGVIRVTCLSDQPHGAKEGDWVEWDPILFVDGVIQSWSSVKLLTTDPINAGYFENTLEFDYGVAKRRIRIIEGRISEKWVFESNPNVKSSIRIVHRHTGSYSLNFGPHALNNDEERVLASVFANAEYPFEVDASPETFYPDPHVENTSVDGWIDKWGPDFDTVHDGTTASNVYDVDDHGNVACRKYSGQYYIERSVFLFDTDSLPDGALVSGAVLSIYGEGVLGTNSAINIYSSSPASNVGLVANDYNDFGTTPFCNSPIGFGSWNTSGYNNFVLNASGLSAIDLEGVSKFGARESVYDVGDVPPTLNEYCAVWFAEKGGGFKPKLVVTYTEAPDPPTDFVASDNRTGEVRCTWTKSDGATKYQLYRDGAPVGAELGDVATTDDATATAGTISNAGNVTASDGGSTAHVTLSLANEATANGTTYTYKVRAGSAAGWSGDSNTNNGKRIVGGITYQWQVNDGGGYDNIAGGTTDPYNYIGAPAGTISNAGNVTATSGVHTNKVVLSLANEATTNGASYSYQCILTSTGASNSPATSDNDTGYRSVGSITYQWQVDDGGGYDDIVGGTTDPYNYTGAPEGTISNAGTVTATSGVHTDKVVLSLAGEATTNGATYDYQCIVSSTGASNSPATSDNSDGYRGVGSITYQWQVDDGEGYDNIVGGTTDSYDYSGAPAGVVTPGAATASDGTSSAHVALSLAGESVADGAAYDYQCIVSAVDASNSPQTSDNDDGYRTTGVITYAWQRSAADSNENFGAIGGGTTDPYNDIGAPSSGAGRWFYCEVAATGTTTQDSTHNRGYRLGAPTVVTSAADDIEETTATLNGEITFTGNVNATVRGFEWDTNSGAPYANDWEGGGDFGTGVFDHGLILLTEGECYYYRAFATNPVGTGYGAEEKFLTKPVEPDTFAAAVAVDDDIDLTWSNGTGSDTTFIVRKDGSYPDNRADGTNVYNGDLELYHDDDAGLVAGHVYYYRAWSYASEDGESQYSDTYDQVSIILTLGLELWYQPDEVVEGTALIDRQGAFDGVITWGGRFADGGDFGVLEDSELIQADDYWVGYTLKIKEVAGDAAPEGEEVEITDSTLATLGGTADSGGAGKDTLVDAALTQTTAYWAGATLTIVTTTDSGAPQGEDETVISWDLPTNTLEFAALTAKVDTGDTYTLTAANSLFFDSLTAVVGADARYEIWDGQKILWGSFPAGISVEVGALIAYVDPVSGEVGGEEPEVAEIPQEPSGLWGGTASEDLPLYTLFNAVAGNLGWTTDVLYVFASIIVSIGLGLALLITTGSTLAAIGGVGVGMAGGMATGMLPVWVLIVYLILGGTWLYASRSM